MARQGEIGSRLNEWRTQIFDLGPSDGQLDKIVHSRLGEINITESVWNTHCETADRVLGVVLHEFRRVAATSYPGLQILDDIVRQGSSREGLKVIDACEFDCIIPFKLDGIQTQHVPVYGGDGLLVPGLLKIQALNGREMEQRYPWMKTKGIFDHAGMIDTRQIQKIVFTSILDKALDRINNSLRDEGRRVGRTYRVVRSVQPTNLQLSVEFDGPISDMGSIFRAIGEVHVQNEAKRIVEAKIDIDFVPGMLIGRDPIPDPYTVNRRERFSVEHMVCERYAVMKWLNKKSQNIKESDHALLWRDCSSGYEKHIMDVARRSPAQRYILTACRILKAYMAREKEREEKRLSHNQLPRIVKTYFIKNICFYCIVLLTIPSESCRLSGMKQALGYMIAFLELSLKAAYLPHSLHGNPWLSAMFPGCHYDRDMRRYNLMCATNRESIQQATRGLSDMRAALKDLYLDVAYLNPDILRLYSDMLVD